MSNSELTRVVKVNALTEEPLVIEASADELSALAKRFGLSAVKALTAKLMLTPKGTAIEASGILQAEWLQSCAVSGEDLPVQIDEPLAFRFVPEAKPADEPDIEIELDAEELDEIEFDGEAFDIGEAVAQSLGLAIDPYATGPNADAMREKAGITSDDVPTGPLAEALAALKKD